MQLNFREIKNIIENKKVLILGSGPTVTNLKSKFMEKYDIIVRMNNYKFFNSCKRIDIYYSYFGRNIKKTAYDLQHDNIKYLMCKYPNTDFREHNNGAAQPGISGDFRKTYNRKGQYFDLTNIPYYIPSLEHFKENYELLNRIPTTGMSAILDILRMNPKEVYISGFDFFKSKIHNINEKWTEGDGNHDHQAEEKLVKDLIINDKIKCDKPLRV